MKRYGFARNTTITFGSMGFGLSLAMFVSALVAHHLGLHAFGFWAIISSISTCASLPRFGAGVSVGHPIAGNDAWPSDAPERGAGSA